MNNILKQQTQWQGRSKQYRVHAVSELCEDRRIKDTEDGWSCHFCACMSFVTGRYISVDACLFLCLRVQYMSPGAVAINLTPSRYLHPDVPTCPQSFRHGNKQGHPAAISAYTRSNTHYRHSDLHHRWPGFYGDTRVPLSRCENY